MTDQPKRIRIGDHVTIYTRGKRGIYNADFWHQQEHCRLSLKTRNLRLARQRALALELQLATGEFKMAPIPKLIDEAINDYISHLETEDRRQKTLVRYRGILSVFRDFSIESGTKTLARVTTLLVDRFRAERKKKLAPKTMHNEGVLLKSFFRWCQQRALVSQNPLESITFQKPLLKPRGGPALDQINQVLVEAPECLEQRLAVVSFTGMRSGELQRLWPVDVDLAKNWVHIVSREGAETKTGYSRKIPIHPRLKPYLAAMTNRTRPWFFTAAPSQKYPDGNHHISAKHLNEDLQKILKRLAIPAGRDGGYTVHSLRHSFETLCVNARIPQRVVDTWLGHRSDQSMAAVYYRLSDEDSQRFMGEVPFGTGALPISGKENER